MKKNIEKEIKKVFKEIDIKFETKETSLRVGKEQAVLIQFNETLELCFSRHLLKSNEIDAKEIFDNLIVARIKENIDNSNKLKSLESSLFKRIKFLFKFK